MVTTTTVYGFQKPAVAGDEDAWGGYLNNNIDKYESILTGSTTITSVVITTADINGGTLDNVVIGGSTAAAITGTTITGTSLVGPLATAAQPNITSLGTLTTLTVDDITINGSTISDGGDLTVDVGGDIILDADGAQIRLKDGGTEYGQLFNDSNSFGVYASIADADIIFKGVDGSSVITALTLDMSDAGTATFNHDVKVNDNGNFFAGTSGDLAIYHDGSNSYIVEQGTGNLNITSNSDLALDVSGNITLDADGANIIFKDGGTEFGHISNGGGPNTQLISNNNLSLRSNSGTTATGNIVWIQGNARPWNDSYFDLGSATYGWKDGYFTGNITVGSNISHDGDSDTYLQFDAADSFRIVVGNTQTFKTTASEITLSTKIDIPDDVYLGWGGGTDRPSIQGNKSSGTLEFFAGGAERLQIDGTNSTFYTDIVAEDHDVYVGDFSGGNMGRLTYDSVNGRGFTYQYDNAFVISNAQGATEQYLVLGDSGASSNETLLGVSIYQSGIYYTRMQLTGIGDLILPNGSLREDWDSVSGTTPTIANAGAYSLTMSGNTTFTFPSPAANYSTGFILQLTGNGSTVTYPNSVDFAGGTAPDAPGNGETDILVFWTRDGGTTWYGALAIDAAG